MNILLNRLSPFDRQVADVLAAFKNLKRNVQVTGTDQTFLDRQVDNLSAMSTVDKRNQKIRNCM